MLKPTSHPRLPARAVAALARAGRPAPARTAALNDFATGVKLEVDSNFAKALPIFMQPPVRQGTLGHYARVLPGPRRAAARDAPSDARQTFQALAAKNPVGYLLEAAALREAECDEALNDQDAAMQVYERLSKTKTTAPDDVLMRFGRAAKAAGHPDKATEAYSRLVYEFPFSDLAPIAGGELESLPIAPIAPGSNRFKLELGRAERLFGARRYAQARPVFDGLRAAARDDDREVVQLRLAECDYFLKRARNARDGVRPFIDKGARQGEALYFYAVATRELGGHDEYLRLVRRIVTEFPNQSWAEEALNNLATYYILQSDDDSAEKTFREMYEKFPTGHYAERAAWKIGWWAYRNGELRRDRARVRRRRRRTSRARTIVRRGCTGRRARTRRCASRRSPTARYALVEADYRNSYYGRLAPKRLDTARPSSDSPPTLTDSDVAAGRRCRRLPVPRRCRRTRRSCARCSGSSSTIRRSTSCTTRRRCGAIRRRFRRRSAGSSTSAASCAPAST